MNTQISLHSGNKEIKCSKDQPETNKHGKRVRYTFIYLSSRHFFSLPVAKQGALDREYRPEKSGT